MKSSTISSKGQVTVPREIRVRLGVSTGDRIEFAVEEGKTVIRPLRIEPNPFVKYKGALKAFRNRKQIRAWIREMRNED